MPELSVGFVLLVASASIFGPLSGWLAAQRGRNPVLWALFGIALGPIAAGLLVTAPPGRCAACRWPVAGWSARCVACGADVRTGATGASVAELIQGPAAVPAVGAAAGSVAPSPAGTAPSRSGGRRSGSSAGGEPRSSRAAASRSASRAKAASTHVADGSSSAPSAPPATLPATPSSPPPPPLRPVEAPWSPRARATGLGHRPETTAPRHLSAVPFDPDPDPAGAIQILGSGVYMGGNRPIETGNRYLLGR
ncbi:MAG TPA: hypothetical protein VFJ71_12110, partial [Candidatus Limnocylindrales bacterium]|nr:hypothetical protein [Candidatus Limnocylindrales bacterium]